MKVLVYMVDLQDWISLLSAFSVQKTGSLQAHTSELFKNETLATLNGMAVPRIENLLRSPTFLSVYAHPFKQVDESVQKGTNVSGLLQPLYQLIGTFSSALERLFIAYYLPGLSAQEQQEQVRKMVQIYKGSSLATFEDWFGLNAFK